MLYLLDSQLVRKENFVFYKLLSFYSSEDIVEVGKEMNDSRPILNEEGLLLYELKNAHHYFKLGLVEFGSGEFVY